MTIVFRADASARMGTGHVTRCATLAETLRARGAQTSFVCREHPGHLAGALEKRGLPVTLLPTPSAPSSVAGEDYAAWLGVPPQEDADQTIAVLRGSRPDWLVVDHYGLGIEWERCLRPHAGKLLVVDDLGNRRHDCDVLLDQNYSTESGDRYADLVPERCEQLLGPRYAILAPEYARQRTLQTPRDGVVRRVLVYFGGADPHNVTMRALEALCTPVFTELDVDLVVGTNNTHRAALEARAAARPRTRTHGTRPHLADLMAQADLAIGAGGVTTWERMCLGLPALVVSIADNQRPTCEALAASGLIAYIGDSNAVGAVEIGRALETLLADPERLAALSAQGARLVDGVGASRVADTVFRGCGDELIQTRNALLKANSCPDGFDTFTFAWIDKCRSADVLAMRNTPRVASMMRSAGGVSDAEHQAFVDRYEQLDRYDFVLIDESRDRYVGVFYVTHLRSTPQIGKYIGEPGYLGKGIAYKAMLRVLDYCRAKAGLGHVTAITRRDNAANIALNAKLGFAPAGVDDDYVVMAREL